MKTLLFKKTLQWGLTTAMCAWCCLLMLIILGEESPEMQMGFLEFFIVKLMAIGAAYATYKACAWCYRKGLFPDVLIREIRRCEEEEL